MVTEWEARTLEEITLSLIRGPFGGALKKEIFVRNGYRVYEQQDAIYGESVEGRYFITQDKYNELARFAISSGDFIVSCSGTIGRIYRLPLSAPAGIINQALLKIAVDESKVDPYFFLQYFKWDDFQQTIIDDTQGGAMKNLVGMDKFRLTKFHLPSLPEQRAIASALTDVDGYINALEQLIVKKQNIKKGAMQELLTGKRRLPGFNSKWIEKTLFDLVPNIRMGQSPDSRFYNSDLHGLPLIQGNADIKNRKTIIRSYTSQITKYAYTGDIILTVRAPVGNVAKATFDCCLGRGVCGFTYVNEYLYQWLVYFEPYWGLLSTGSTFDSISGDKLKEVIVGLPDGENEQAAIAEILSDMDAEIDALTEKLIKAQNLKQGMMQELLAGRIRLI